MHEIYRYRCEGIGLEMKRETHAGGVILGEYTYEGVLYAHHFNTHISPPFYRYIACQSMCACSLAFPDPLFID